MRRRVASAKPTEDEGGRDKLQLIRLLGSFDRKLGRILIHELLRALERADSRVIDPRRLPARRVCLKEDVFAALIDWLVRTGWTDGLRQRPTLGARIGLIIWQLIQRRQYGDRQEELMYASLVTRYLILLEAIGVKTTDRDKVKAATFGANPMVLPRYWPTAPWMSARLCRQVTASRLRPIFAALRSFLERFALARATQGDFARQ